MRLTNGLRENIAKQVATNAYGEKIKIVRGLLRDAILPEFLTKTVFLRDIPEEYRKYVEEMIQIQDTAYGRELKDETV